MSIDPETVTLVVSLTAGVQALTIVEAAALAVVYFRYGSSTGSRTKDDVIASLAKGGVTLPQPAAPVNPPAVPHVDPPPATHPAPAQTPAADASSVHTITDTGKMSVFGGPTDSGMATDEPLALYDDSNAHLIAGFLLSAEEASRQANRTITGVGRRLDPTKFYVAYRFDYDRTPKPFLRGVGVHLTNPRTGKVINCLPVDWGPNIRTGRIVDMSPAAAAALGLKTDDTVTITIPLPSSAATAPAAAPTAAPAGGEPVWLVWARHEIGQHEDTDNTGPVVQKYIDLSHCGAQHDPWCAIFANAALEANGIPGTRSPAAQSFCTHPGFTKVDAPQMGDLAVFWRGSRSSGQGHVGFYVGEDATHVQTLGGNEGDQVKIEPIPKVGSSMGLLGYWRPVAAATTTPTEPKLT